MVTNPMTPRDLAHLAISPVLASRIGSCRTLACSLHNALTHLTGCWAGYRAVCGTALQALTATEHISVLKLLVHMSVVLLIFFDASGLSKGPLTRSKLTRLAVRSHGQAY